MTEPFDWVPADMMAALRDQLDEGEANEQRRRELAPKVKDIAGPLGDLLRTVSVMYADWVDAYEMRAVTEAESVRMEQIADAAVACEAWLSEGRR
jgi:hypothetical protein